MTLPSKWLVAILAWGGVGAHLLLGQTSMQTLVTNGPLAKRINIVFLSEGYTTNQLGQFPGDARKVLTNLLVTPPFSAYANYFNAFAILVPSVESGSDHPSTSTYRNTYFDSTYDTSGIARLLTIPSTGRSRVNSLLATYLPQYDIVAVIVNDTVYGGSGGFPLVTSVNSASPEVAIHELGHSFSGLGDEYGDAYPGYPDIEEPNTTTQTNRLQIKWTSWIQAATPVPTPATAAYNSVVGLFEGAHYHTTGWYRPKLNCKMRSLGVAFCEVCGETLIKSIYTQVRPIETAAPATNALIRLTNAAAVTLTVSNLPASSPPLNVQWWLNTLPVGGATSAVFTVSGLALPPGTNSIRVEVSDGTSWVRVDPAQLLKDQRTWQVVAVTVPPVLGVGRNGDQVSITWPSGCAGFILETSSELVPSGWTPVLTIGSETSATLAPSNSKAFFRLRKP